jgi:hypothetical protein
MLYLSNFRANDRWIIWKLDRHPGPVFSELRSGAGCYLEFIQEYSKYNRLAHGSS